MLRTHALRNVRTIVSIEPNFIRIFHKTPDFFPAVADHVKNPFPRCREKGLSTKHGSIRSALYPMRYALYPLQSYTNHQSTPR